MEFLPGTGNILKISFIEKYCYCHSCKEWLLATQEDGVREASMNVSSDSPFITTNPCKRILLGLQ
jgi:hypothetical protein